MTILGQRALELLDDYLPDATDKLADSASHIEGYIRDYRWAKRREVTRMELREFINNELDQYDSGGMAAGAVTEEIMRFISWNT